VCARTFSRVCAFLRAQFSCFRGFRVFRVFGFSGFGKVGISRFLASKNGSFFELFFDFSPWNLKSRGMCHKSANLAFFWRFWRFWEKWVFSCFFETFAFFGNPVFASRILGAFGRFDVHAWRFIFERSRCYLTILSFWSFDVFKRFDVFMIDLFDRFDSFESFFWFNWNVLKRFDFNWFFGWAKLRFFAVFWNFCLFDMKSVFLSSLKSVKKTCFDQIFEKKIFTYRKKWSSELLFVCQRHRMLIEAFRR